MSEPTKSQDLHRLMHKDWVPGQTTVELDRANSHHVREVLRLRRGQSVRALVTAGYDLLLQIDGSEPGRVTCTVTGRVDLAPEPGLRVTIYQGLARPERFEYVLQKCTEIGAFEYVPVVTRRTVVKAVTSNSGSRMVRWRRIVEEAALQSGRSMTPTVHEPLTLGDLLRQIPTAAPADLQLVAYERETVPLGQALGRQSGPIQTARMFIGPEAGLDEAEVAELAAVGFQPVSLGPRILRTETAGPAMLAILLYELADFGGVPRA